MAKVILYLGVVAFVFVYTLTLLSALYIGVERFLPLVFYSLVFFLSAFILILMIDRLELPMARLDLQVAAATLISSVVMLFIVGLPQFGARVRAELATLTLAPTLENLLTTLLFVSLSETFFKLVILQSLRLAGAGWGLSLVVTSGLFALAHVFRHGLFLPAMLYLFIMGLILLGTGMLPRLLKSEVEMSIYPPIFAHTVHNVVISAASVFMWY